MPKYDDRTSKGWPLPHRLNKLSDDADRLRETLTAIDGNITEIEGTLKSVGEVNEFLSTRMEVIVGEATEDTEILDARVDAEGKVHQNLGQNVRYIHSGLLEVIEDIKYGVQEFQGLLHQFSAVAEAQIQDELNAHDAHERRKAEIQQEALTRLLQDDGLQNQINAASEATLNISLTLHELAERFRARTEGEALERRATDENLQREINTLAEAFLRDVLNLHEAINRRKEALKQEIQTRIAEDEKLQAQISDNARNIQRETEKRAEDDEAISERVDLLDEAVALREEEIDTETQARVEGDEGLARQANANAEANIRTALALQEINERRKADLLREEQERIAHDEDLQRRIDETAQASLENALGIHQEAEQRRKSDARIEALNEETVLQSETDVYHQHQIDEAIHAILQNSLTLSEVLARRREALIREEQARVDENAALQSEIDTASQASMTNALNLQQEAERRREAVSQLKQTDEYQQTQLDGAVRAILENSANLHDAVLRRKAAESLERYTRFEEDANLQAQQDTNAQATMELTANLSREAEKRRELAQAIADIKSPVDWSKAESLAIAEPRCAIVNFSGLKSMPTSKNADIHAFIEFWDMQGNYFKKPIVCSAQGSSSLSYVKKNVKFDLLNDDGSEFELKIGNWVVQDGFHLKAYYTDFFRGVAVTSYKFWDEVMRFNGLDKDRPYKRAMIDSSSIQPSGTSLNNPEDLTLQLDNGALCHPDGFPCIVYLNGTFYGVYSWQIKKQRKNYRMDKSTVEHIHLDGSLYTQYFWNGVINWTTFEIRNPNKLYCMDGKKYDGDAPRELIDETSEKYDPSDKNHVRSAKVKKYIQDFVANFGVLKTLYTAYKTTPNDENLAAVKAKYEELFDLENMRDYLIFSDVIKNSDGFGKNWQWTTYDGVKWFVNAYDLDMSYGGHWQGIQITAPLTGHITTSTALPVYYVALLYKSELEARYRELRDAGVISVNNILSKLADWTSRIGVGNYELEYERWPNSPCILNYTDSIYRVKRWLEVEIANMDKVYRYSPDEEEAEAIEVLNDTEAEIRASEDAGILRQTQSLAEAVIAGELNHALINEERRREEEQERQTRYKEDAGILAQVNKLAEAQMWTLVNEQETKRKLSEIAQQIEESPGRSATDDEFDEMLDELYKQ